MPCSVATQAPSSSTAKACPVPRHGVVFDGREGKLQEVAGQIPFTDKKAVRVGKRCSWYFSKRMRIATVSHPAEPVEASHRVVLEGSSCDRGEQGIGEQPGGLGGTSHVEGVPPSLDGHRDLSSGRQAAVGSWGLSGAQWQEPAPDLIRGADAPHVSCQRSVQSSPEPVEGCTPCTRAVRMTGLVER